MLIDFNKYQNGACGTFKSHVALTPEQARLLDWGLGLCGEAGETSELLKHHIFHDEKLDKMKLAKELGDILWYVAAICQTTQIPMEACAALNLAKLEHRHGKAFSAAASSVRHEREEVFTNTEIYKQLQTMIVAE